jgi:hypothetical protein
MGSDFSNAVSRKPFEGVWARETQEMYQVRGIQNRPALPDALWRAPSRDSAPGATPQNERRAHAAKIRRPVIFRRWASSARAAGSVIAAGRRVQVTQVPFEVLSCRGGVPRLGPLYL